MSGEYHILETTVTNTGKWGMGESKISEIIFPFKSTSLTVGKMLKSGELDTVGNLSHCRLVTSLDMTRARKQFFLQQFDLNIQEMKSIDVVSLT